MTSLLHTLPLLLSSYILAWIGFSVFRQNRDATVNRLFLAVALTIAFHSLIDYLFRTAPSAELAHLWHGLHFFRPLMLAMIIHFILHFTGRWERYERPVALLTVYGPALFFSAVNLFSDTLRGTPAESPAGWISLLTESGIMKYGYLTWCVLVSLFAAYVVWRYCFENTGWRRKRNRLFAYLFAVMVLCALSLIIIRWVFIPDVPEITGLAMSLACIILGGLVWKLKLLLTPADIAEDILAIMPGSLILIDPDNTIVRVNRSTQKLCGYKEEELKTQNLNILFNEEVLAKIGFPEAKSKTHIPPVPGEIQTTMKTKHGETKPVLIIATRMYSKNQEPVGTVLVATDLTYIKKTEAQLLKAQRLESLETVAGGIAHDFNNLLTTICANLSIARVAESPEEKDRSIGHAENATSIAAELTGQLLGFSREKAPRKETCSIADILEGAADLSLRGTNVDREISVSKDICAIEADRYQMLQVLINLLINARQAMPGGGTISISAEEKQEGTDKQENPLQVPAVEIVIVDEGAGIAEEVLPNIFDPFYTTKSRGSGLGLVIAQSIVEKHDGYIGIDSKPGTGTTARILLPAFQGKAAPVKKQPVSITKHEGRVLVMDDDTMVRTAMADMLELMGLEVEHARNGNEAIELYLKSMAQKQPFNGVILDLTVGNKHGAKETMKRLLEIDPDIKALICSGYHYDKVVLDFQKYGFKGALPKPVKMTELNKAVGALLKEDTAGSQ